MDTTLEALARKVGRTTDDEEFKQAWAAVVAQGWRLEDLTTHGEREECVLLLREGLRGTRPAPAAWMRHARVLSDNAARQAEAETDVQTFRAEMLGGCLLSDDAASEWIQSRTGRFEGLQSLVAFQCGGELRRAPVAGSAALERLKRLVDALAERYRWPEDAATIFLLTGRTPLRLPSVTLRASSHHGQKILVEADPWVPPGVVRDAYAAARDSLTPQPRRVPRISPKRRELVAFVNARGGVPSRALCIDWNNEHPQWRYQDGANFIRDYHRTVERM